MLHLRFLELFLCWGESDLGHGSFGLNIFLALLIRGRERTEMGTCSEFEEIMVVYDHLGKLKLTWKVAVPALKYLKEFCGSYVCLNHSTYFHPERLIGRGAWNHSRLKALRLQRYTVEGFGFDLLGKGKHLYWRGTEGFLCPTCSCRCPGLGLQEQFQCEWPFKILMQPHYRLCLSTAFAVDVDGSLRKLALDQLWEVGELRICDWQVKCGALAVEKGLR